MSDFSRAMQVFGALQKEEAKSVATRLLSKLLDGQGRVKYRSISDIHSQLVNSDQFALVKNSSEFVLPGGRQLFYVRGVLLIRIKTTGTRIRPTPHLTISAASGIDWPEEIMKLNRAGEFIPKLGAIGQAAKENDWRSLSRISTDTAVLQALDDAWANSCHFDFVTPFDATGANTLPVSGGN
ncbi:MAG: hypothetical protein NT069_29960 [Planctomycetota bacterium]|nr:hypothetical protein [Planctomycetota bacterium]